MPKTRAQKTDVVAALASAFQKGKAVAFADYQGMTVPAITSLRKKLKGAQVDYHVAKKTLLKLAAKQAGYDIDFKSLPGMLGAAFAFEDEMAPAKLIGEAGKTAPIKLVGGIIGGKTVDQAYIVALSKLPGRQELLAQLLSVMNGPTAAFVRLLNAKREKMEAPA